MINLTAWNPGSTFTGVSTVSNMTKNILLWLVIAMVLMSVFENFTSPQGNAAERWTTRLSR